MENYYFFYYPFYFIILAILLYILLRISLLLLSYYLQRRFRVNLTVRSIRFNSLRTINISCPALAVNINIEHFSLSSKWFNSKYNCLLVFKFSDIRLEGDIAATLKRFADFQNTTPAGEGGRTAITGRTNDSTSSLLVVRPWKRIGAAISHYLSSNFQVSLHNTSLMQLGAGMASKPNTYRINDCLLHSTIQLIQFGFAKKSKSEITFQVDGFAIKVLQSNTDLEEKAAGKACLVQMSFPFRFVYFPEDKSMEILIPSSEMIVYDMLKLVKMVPNKMNRFEVPRSISKNEFADKIMLAFQTILKTHLVKSISFKLNASTIKLVRECGKKELTFSVEPIELFVNKVDDNRLESSLTVANVLIQDSESIIDFSLQKCATLCKIERDQFSGKLFFHLLLEISTCSFVINYANIDHWFQYFVNLFATTKTTSRPELLPGQTSTPNHSGKYINKFVFLMVVNDVSVSLKRSENYSVMVTYGMKHLKTTCVRNIDEFNRETSIELLLETFWCWNGNINLKPVNPNSLKKYNEKHVPLFMSTLLLKFGNMNSSDLRINCVMDGLQISLEYYINYLENLDLRSFRHFFISEPRPVKPPSAVTRYNLLGQINFTSVNIFTSQLMMRMDSMACDLDGNKITNSINGFGVNGMYAPSATLSCLKASELVQNRIIYFSVMRINFITMGDTINELTVSLTEEIFVQWSPSFHVSVLELCVDFYKLYQNLVIDGDETNVPQPTTTTSSSRTLNLNLKLDGKISLGVLLTNEGDTMRLETGYLTVSFTDSRITNSKCESFDIYFNQVLNCQVKHLVLMHLPSAKNYLDRKSFKLTETELNDAIELAIEHVALKFPYQFNFAYYFNEKFLGIVKWLRTGKDSTKKTETPQRLAADFILKLKQLVIELEDDPFEVQLNNNYELMVDEYNESQKRWSILMEKIEERRRKNIIITDAKIEELKKAFDLQNAKTYVERSRKMYKSDQMCRQLFTIQAENVQLNLISDTAYDRYEKMVKLIRSIDVYSPMPDDIRFSTIWCRQIFCSIGLWQVSLRDFPQLMLNSKKLYFKGVLLGAEQEPSARAKRTCEIDMGPNFAPIKIERSMTTMKFYHDIVSNIGSLIYTHGACWEPILQQVNLSFELIFRPSNDPSPSLTWWDKLRFLFHGVLNVASKQISIVFHASLDPNNSTELIEFSFLNSNVRMDTGKINVFGDLDVFVHAASKYDECRIIHLPDCAFGFALNWECSGNKNDHHSVMPCARDKLPEYTCNQVHDSYRSFRSHHLNLSASIETKEELTDTVATVAPDGDLDRVPQILIYNSTLRWLENKLFMITGFPRLTRRGKLFHNTRPRKMPFSRLFKTIRFTICMQKLEITYWSSFNRHRGFKIASHRLSHSAEHRQTFSKINDNLKQRPKPIWELIYMNTELQDVEIELYKTKVAADSMNLGEFEPNNTFFLNVKNVTYNRQTKLPQNVTEEEGQSPTHRLIVHDLKGAWTKDNRDIVLSLFDSYFKTQLLKRNLSTEALRLFKEQQQMANGNGGSPSKSLSSQTDKPSHHGLSKGNAANMLQKLINEVEQSENIVDTEQIENVVNDRVELYGIEACQANDVLQNNWLIELINSQVVLRGCETDGYVIVSAAKAQIMQRIHQPVWKNRILYSKTTWQGSLECMQYYATVDAGGLRIDEFTWLDLDDIEDDHHQQQQQNREIADISELVGSGRSVGGVVNSEAGGSTCTESAKVPIQLQRIVSRCRCKFFYASYGENADPNNYETVPPLPQDDDLLPLEPWDREVAVDTFTLTHEQLEIFTNSQQYAMIMDLVNNLLLYVEPHKKEVYDKQQRIRFSMQLNSLEAQREPISELQEKVRSLLNKIKMLEKESFLLYKKIHSDAMYYRDHREYPGEFAVIEAELEKCKRELNIESENLSIMINCYKEAQLIASKTKERQVAAQESRLPSMAQVIRRNEVCFKQAGWRLTDADGQLGLADLELNNFLYTKVSKNDDSVEHSFELGYIRVQNMIPNQAYRDVLQPTELQPNMPVDRNRALRILCIERAPVGGIAVKEHLEVNVIPLTLGLTYAFFKKMLKFFFPERSAGDTGTTGAASTTGTIGSSSVVSATAAADGAASEISDSDSIRSKRSKASALRRDESSLSLATSSSYNFSGTSKMVKDITHIEKMRERASKNQTFVYIKIPEVPIKISYKGNKNKNLEDLHDVHLTLPTFEYHNRTCTWLDLLMALKNDSKRVLLQQALRHKFQVIKITRPLPLDAAEKNKASGSTAAANAAPSVQANNQSAEDAKKVRILLGNIVAPPQKNTKSAKSILMFGSKNK